MDSMWKLNHAAFKGLIHRLLYPDMSQRKRAKATRITRATQWRYKDKVDDKVKSVFD